MAILMNLVASALGSKNSKVDDFILSKTAKPEEPANNQQALFNKFAALGTPYKGPSER